jgi:hypothetical protein
MSLLWFVVCIGASLYKKTRDLFRNKKNKNCWTHDGKILVKSLAEKTIQITDEKDLEQFLYTIIQLTTLNNNNNSNIYKVKNGCPCSGL